MGSNANRYGRESRNAQLCVKAAVLKARAKLLPLAGQSKKFIVLFQLTLEEQLNESVA